MGFYKAIRGITADSPEGIRMFLRLARSVGCPGYAQGKTNMDRIYFDSMDSFNRFKAEFSEMLPYLFDEEESKKRKIEVRVTPITGEQDKSGGGLLWRNSKE